MAKSTFLYVSVIRTTPEKLWSALTDGEFMKQYWFGSHCDSQWTAGSSWKMVNSDGKILVEGEIVESIRPKRLVIRWTRDSKPDFQDEVPSLCVMELEPVASAVKLTVTHSIEREPSKLIGEVSKGWPLIISNLKSLLETGSIALDESFKKSCG
ncbi:MAG TPA: SRPBCC family protein [Dyella sp.]|uniref:SRPBCC family protein n=1 Tax=Dyella sp. TaxID=1869338 RepID=UPI002BC82014|nr:SRPBCC family protein [Dyella sp.]HTV85410.1 SRPBCC family protein [Dyella sp.]